MKALHAFCALALSTLTLQSFAGSNIIRTYAPIYGASTNDKGEWISADPVLGTWEEKSKTCALWAPDSVFTSSTNTVDQTRACTLTESQTVTLREQNTAYLIYRNSGSGEDNTRVREQGESQTVTGTMPVITPAPGVGTGGERPVSQVTGYEKDAQAVAQWKAVNPNQMALVGNDNWEQPGDNRYWFFARVMCTTVDTTWVYSVTADDLGLMWIDGNRAVTSYDTGSSYSRLSYNVNVAAGCHKVVNAFANGTRWSWIMFDFRALDGTLLSTSTLSEWTMINPSAGTTSVDIPQN